MGIPSIVTVTLALVTILSVATSVHSRRRKKDDFDHIIQDYVGHDIGDIREFKGYKGKGTVPRIKIDTIVKRKKKYGYGYIKERNPKGVKKPQLFAINTNPDLLHDPHADEKEVAATLLFAGDDFSKAKYGIPAPKKKKKKYKRRKPHYEPHDSGYKPHKMSYKPPPPKYPSYPHHEGGGYGSPHGGYERESKQDVLTGILVIPTQIENKKQDHYDAPPNLGYGPVPRSGGGNYDDIHKPDFSTQHGDTSGYGEHQDNGYDKGFDFDFEFSYKPKGGGDGYGSEAGYDQPHPSGYKEKPPIHDPHFDSGYPSSDYGSSNDYKPDQGYPQVDDYKPQEPQYTPPNEYNDYKPPYTPQNEYNDYKPQESQYTPPNEYNDYKPPEPPKYPAEPLYPHEPSYHSGYPHNSHNSAPSGYGPKKPEATPLSGLLILLAEAKADKKKYSSGKGYEAYGHKGYDHEPYKEYPKKRRYKKPKKDIKFSDKEKVVLFY